MNDSKNAEDWSGDDDFFSNDDQNLDCELKLGAKYSSFVELQKAVDIYCKQNNVRFFRSDSRKLKSAPNRISPQIIEKTPDYLVYYSLTYSCVFGGKSFKSRNRTGCNNQSQNGCKFIVRIGLTKNCQLLQVIKMSDPKVHNHELSETILSEMPKIRSNFNNFSSTPKTFKKPMSIAPRVNNSTNYDASGSGRAKINKNGEGDEKMASSANFKNQLMHMHSLATTLMEYRKTGLFCDTAIIASDGMLFAHSAVLSAFCPRFHSMLTQKPFYKPKPNMIDLAKYSSLIINKFLDYFYIGKICMQYFEEIKELANNLGMDFNVVDVEDSNDLDKIECCSDKTSNRIFRNNYDLDKDEGMHEQSEGNEESSFEDNNSQEKNGKDDSQNERSNVNSDEEIKCKDSEKDSNIIPNSKQRVFSSLSESVTKVDSEKLQSFSSINHFKRAGGFTCSKCTRTYAFKYYYIKHRALCRLKKCYVPKSINQKYS